MTRGFKLFLLIILFFTAVWAYQFRALDLRALLEGELPPVASASPPPRQSPVDGVVNPQDLVVLLRLRPAPPVEKRRPAEPWIRSAELNLIEEWREPERDAGHRIHTDPPPSYVPRKEVLPDPPLDPPRDPPHQRPSTPGREELLVNRESVQKNTPKKNTPAERSTRTIIHKVREGETLAAIARRYYRNDTERWPEIFAANRDRLKDPDFLTPGMELRIPGVLVPGSDSISRRNDRLKMTEMVRR